MSERDGFLAAIRADPADDLPRLAFADWLDEHGEGPRAAFIREQVAFARSGKTRAPFRWTTLLGQHGEEWFPDWPANTLLADPAQWRPATYRRTRGVLSVVQVPELLAGRRALVRRGFIEGVSLDAREFVTNAAALFATHPICSVLLMHKMPERSYTEIQSGHGTDTPGRYSWSSYELELTTGAYILPWKLFTELCRLDLGFQLPRLATCRWFATVAEAHDALSRACVAYGRRAAGLEGPA